MLFKLANLVRKSPRPKLARYWPRIALVALLIVLIASPTIASADEMGGQWLVSQHEFRNLELTPDLSSPQWSGARMVTVAQNDGVNINVMSVHNNTYVVILVERNFNTSLDRAGVALNFNSSSMIWARIGDQQVLINCHHVESTASLNDGMLTVVFGRPLASNGSKVAFEDNIPFSGFVKVITWDNGSALGSISFENAPTFGLELLPYIDSYPTAPLVYAAVILIAGLGFIFIEARKYRRGRQD